MGPMKKFDLNKLPEETEMEELAEGPQAIAVPRRFPGSDEEGHASTFDTTGGGMSDTRNVLEHRVTIMRREPEISLRESAYATSWLHHIGSTSSHPGTLQIDARQPCQPPSAIQGGGSAVAGSSNALQGDEGAPVAALEESRRRKGKEKFVDEGGQSRYCNANLGDCTKILGTCETPKPLPINEARELPGANLRRSNRRPARPQPVVKAVTSTKRKGRHGPKSKSSEFRGVTFYKRTRRWEAHIWHDNAQVYLGASSSKESAARAYDKAALILTGPEADINFKAEEYAEDIATLGKLTKNQIVIYLRRESRGGRKQAKFPGVKGIRKNKAFQATYKHDPKKKSSELLGTFGSEEDAAKAIYEEAVRRDNKSIAELIRDTYRVRQLPIGPRPARESKCNCAHKDQSNPKVRITRKRTLVACKKPKLSQAPTFKRQENGADTEPILLKGFAGRFLAMQEAGQQPNNRSQQAPDHNNWQTSCMVLRGWPAPAASASSHHGPSTGKTVARRRCELPPMPSQTSNSFMPPDPTNDGFNAHFNTPLQQPPAALPSTNLRNGDNGGSLAIYQSWLAEDPLRRYIAGTFTSRYGFPKSLNCIVVRPIARRPWDREVPVAVPAGSVNSVADSSTTQEVNNVRLGPANESDAAAGGNDLQEM